MNAAKKLVQQRWSKTTKEERSAFMKEVSKQRFKSEEEKNAHMAAINKKNPKHNKV